MKKFEVTIIIGEKIVFVNQYEYNFKLSAMATAVHDYISKESSPMNTSELTIKCVEV